MAGHFGPAIHRDLAVFGIQADHDVPGKSIARLMQEARIFHRSGTDDDVGDAIIEITFDSIQITNTPAELHRNLGADDVSDGLDRGFIDRLTSESAVQVH